MSSLSRDWPKMPSFRSISSALKSFLLSASPDKGPKRTPPMVLKSPNKNIESESSTSSDSLPQKSLLTPTNQLQWNTLEEAGLLGNLWKVQELSKSCRQHGAASQHFKKFTRFCWIMDRISIQNRQGLHRYRKLSLNQWIPLPTHVV